MTLSPTRTTRPSNSRRLAQQHAVKVVCREVTALNDLVDRLRLRLNAVAEEEVTSESPSRPYSDVPNRTRG